MLKRTLSIVSILFIASALLVGCLPNDDKVMRDRQAKIDRLNAETFASTYSDSLNFALNTIMQIARDQNVNLRDFADGQDLSEFYVDAMDGVQYFDAGVLEVRKCPAGLMVYIPSDLQASGNNSDTTLEKHLRQYRSGSGIGMMEMLFAKYGRNSLGFYDEPEQDGVAPNIIIPPAMNAGGICDTFIRAQIDLGYVAADTPIVLMEFAQLDDYFTGEFDFGGAAIGIGDTDRTRMATISCEDAAFILGRAGDWTGIIRYECSGASCGNPAPADISGGFDTSCVEPNTIDQVDQITVDTLQLGQDWQALLEVVGGGGGDFNPTALPPSVTVRCTNAGGGMANDCSVADDNEDLPTSTIIECEDQEDELNSLVNPTGAVNDGDPVGGGDERHCFNGWNGDISAEYVKRQCSMYTVNEAGERVDALGEDETLYRFYFTGAECTKDFPDLAACPFGAGRVHVAVRDTMGQFLGLTPTGTPEGRTNNISTQFAFEGMDLSDPLVAEVYGRLAANDDYFIAPDNLNALSRETVTTETGAPSISDFDSAIRGYEDLIESSERVSCNTQNQNCPPTYITYQYLGVVIDRSLSMEFLGNLTGFETDVRSCFANPEDMFRNDVTAEACVALAGGDMATVQGYLKAVYSDFDVSRLAGKTCGTTYKDELGWCRSASNEGGADTEAGCQPSTCPGTCQVVTRATSDNLNNLGAADLTLQHVVYPRIYPGVEFVYSDFRDGSYYQLQRDVCQGDPFCDISQYQSEWSNMVTSIAPRICTADGSTPLWQSVRQTIDSVAAKGTSPSERGRVIIISDGDATDTGFSAMCGSGSTVEQYAAQNNIDLTVMALPGASFPECSGRDFYIPIANAREMAEFFAEAVERLATPEDICELIGLPVNDSPGWDVGEIPDTTFEPLVCPERGPEGSVETVTGCPIPPPPGSGNPDFEPYCNSPVVSRVLSSGSGNSTTCCDGSGRSCFENDVEYQRTCYGYTSLSAAGKAAGSSYSCTGLGTEYTDFGDGNTYDDYRCTRVESGSCNASFLCPSCVPSTKFCGYVEGSCTTKTVDVCVEREQIRTTFECGSKVCTGDGAFQRCSYVSRTCTGTTSGDCIREEEVERTVGCVRKSCD